PKDDPTLLFTNAGMVQFKRVFLGQEDLGFKRAVTSQKCVRAGGKHNDLEQVGKTARHHTFFEMLGNFSFGDYFKRDAIAFAWELLTGDLGLEPERLYATVHHTDDEAAELWREVAGLPDERIYRLGDEDNFWQMADTGPCGPCSELHYDLRPEGERGETLSRDAFVEAGERGEFLELWNLVFMQFDRDEDGELEPLPAPSIDTGAGLERLAAVLQEVDSNYHTDLFLPLLRRVADVVGRAYDPDSEEGVSFRVLTDHARAVAFLLADGVFPSSEGRGYVLRRILRRAVRHAWLLGRREPTLVEVVDEVVGTMGDAYPELERRREHLLQTTRAEEERFLSTIEGGLARFDEVAPPLGDAGGVGEGDRPVIPGDEAFKLYDTYGFPLDLTQLMAEERGYRVDVAGFEEALEAQRARSRADREAAEIGMEADALREGWTELAPDADQTFVGYDLRTVETEVVALRGDGGRPGLQLRENPFYVEGGGQVSDSGRVEGEGWALRVEEVRDVAGRVAVFGSLEEGEL
ncbi:MAG TPA: alanine--tRNA ligase, partial [Longimicrobiales bacterium]|nr:alanine--tRNA ligase [Longimicrobiales bacterium]